MSIEISDDGIGLHILQFSFETSVLFQTTFG